MLIVIPISSSDADLIEPFSSALNHFGPTGFDALVVVRPTDAGLADTLREKVSGVFGEVAIHVFPADGPSGWPKGPNFYWAQTISHLTQIKNAKPWLWLELDSTPLRKGWAAEIFTAYNLGQKPFMGAKEDTLSSDADGKVHKSGEHMVGVGVYPPDVINRSLLWSYTPQMNDPFDVVCQWEFLPKLNDTPLIQHAFRTKDYRREGDVVICADNSDLPDGVSFARPLSTEAVLHHGCNDGSLSGIITKAQSGPKSLGTKGPEPKKSEASDPKKRVAAIREQGVFG
jgi:hypothetical protein